MGGATGQTIELEHPLDADTLGGGGSESTRSTKVDRTMGLATTLILPLVLGFTPAPQNNVTTSVSAPQNNQAMMKLLDYVQNDASMAQPVVGASNAAASADKAVDQARTRLNIVNDAMKGMQGGGQDNNTANVAAAPVMAVSTTTMLGAGQGSLVTSLQQTSTYTSYSSSGGTESKSGRDQTPGYTLTLSPGPNDASTVALNQTPAMPGVNGGMNGARQLSGSNFDYVSASLGGVNGINIADMTKFKNDTMSVLPAAKTIFSQDPSTTYRAQRLEIPKAAPSIA